MTFLNPAVLFGLISAAIPILLHLFNLRKLKTIEFSTLSFLKELQKTKIRRIKVRQWLLLLLRTLLILLIVLAFSRPTLKGSLPGSMADRAKTTAVLVIDDSPSMIASDEHGEFFKQATDAGVGITNLLRDGDELVLTKLSETRFAAAPTSAQKNFSVVRSTLHELKPSFIHRSLDDALRSAATSMASSKNFNQEVYILSDFKAGMIPPSPALVSDLTFSPAVQFFLLPIGERELQNISIDTVEIPNAIFEMNKPFAVDARITNHSSVAAHNHLISIIQDGARVAQKGFDLSAGQSTTIEFSITPKRTGFVNGMVELEDDDLEFDNRRYFTVDVPAEIRVAVLGSLADAHYIQLALQTKLTDSTTSLRLNELSLDRLTTAQLSNTDVIILSNPHNLDAESIEKLRTFVTNGGGMIIFPGTQTAARDFNASFASAFGISKMLPAEPQQTEASTKSFIEFSKTDLRHPVFQGMFEAYDAAVHGRSPSQQPLLESPRILQSINLQPASNAHAIISLSNGFPFLTDEHVGAGHIFIFSVAAVPQWSDFPFKGLFVPLLHRSVAYLASPQTSDRSIFAGDEYKIPVEHISAQRIRIIQPNNESNLLNAAGNDRFFQFTQTDLPGNYTQKNGTNIAGMFSVNVDPAESNTVRATDFQINNTFQRWKIPQNHIHRISDVGAIEKTIMQVRLGTEWWKHLLALALLVAIAELLVARETKKELVSLYAGHE